MRLDQEAIKLCYSTHRQQTAVKNDYAYEAEPYSATSIANILPEGCRLVGIKRGVTLHMLKNSVATHLPEQGGIWVISKSVIGCSFQANFGCKELIIVSV